MKPSTRLVIPLPFTLFRGKEVVPVAHFAKATKKDHRKAVDRSNVYKLLKSNPKTFVEGEDMFLYAVTNYPQDYQVYKKKYGHFEKNGALPNSDSIHFITYEGVIKACRYWNIDPETLVSRNQKAENAPIQKMLLDREDAPAKPDSPFKGLLPISKETEGSLTIPEHLLRNYRVYVRDLMDPDENVLFGLNNVISKYVSEFPLLKKQITSGDKKVYCQVYLDTANSNKKRFIIAFVEKGTPDSFPLRATCKDGEYTNISLRKTQNSKVLLEALISAGLSTAFTRSVELDTEHQSVVATFGA